MAWGRCECSLEEVSTRPPLSDLDMRSPGERGLTKVEDQGEVATATVSNLVVFHPPWPAHTSESPRARSR